MISQRTIPRVKFDSHIFRSYLLKAYKKLQGFLFGAFLVFLVGSAAVIAIDYWVSWQAEDRIIYDIDDVPELEVAVVLGTSKYLGRTLNDYYKHRIEAAIELFDREKVDQFLLSGDNAHRSYNEPWTMKRDLLKAGVPDERINLDYAGFRTLDSIVRAKKIFDTDNFLIITQKFHCERALFIAILTIFMRSAWRFQDQLTIREPQYVYVKCLRAPKHSLICILWVQRQSSLDLKSRFNPVQNRNHFRFQILLLTRL